MKRILIVLAMIAGSVFMATPVLAADGDPATETVAANETPADPEPLEDPNDVAPPAEPPPADPPPAEALPAEPPPAKKSVAVVAVAAVVVEELNICHAASSQSNPYQPNSPNASGDASGHLYHTGPVWSPGASSWGDIIPPFTFEGVEHSLNWNAAGMAIYNNGCNLVSVTATAPSATAPTCAVDGALVIPSIAGVAYLQSPSGTGPADYTVTATAAPGYVLSGANSWLVTVLPKLTGAQCLTTVATVAPTEHDIVACDTFGSVELPTTVGVIYAFDPAGASSTEGAWKVVATPAPGYAFANGSVTEWTGDLGAHSTCPVIPDGDPVPFCYATNAEGNAYTMPIASAAEIIGAYLHIGDLAVWYPGAKADGHTWGDIIPPFIYDGNGYSLNWDATGAQIIWNNNCAAVLVTPEPPTRADACDQDGSVSLPNTVGVKYEFTVGNGIDGPWEITAAAADGYQIVGGFVFTGNAGFPADCAAPDDHGILGDEIELSDHDNPSDIDDSPDDHGILGDEIELSDHGNPSDIDDSSDLDDSSGDDDPSDNDDPSDQADRADPVSTVLPDTGGVSRGWIPFSGLLMVAGTIVLVRRRTI